jgi:hypothetical protein
MEPDVLPLADLCQVGDGVDRGRRGRANRGNERTHAGELSEIVGPHPELAIHRHLLHSQAE